MPKGVPDIGKVLVDRRHRDGTLTHRRGYTSGRPAAHVPRGEDSRLTCLQNRRLHARRAVSQSSVEVGAGQHEPMIVELDEAGNRIRIRPKKD